MKKLLFCIIFPFFMNAQTAFISGNDTICDNGKEATIQIDFTGNAPFTFVYALDGAVQPSITTTINPHIISTYSAGNYTLISFSDANVIGSTSGSGLVTILESPTAIIHLESDTLSIVNPVANFSSQSIGNIVAWNWNFGDNTSNAFSSNATHYYDSLGIYQTSLIVTADNGCVDTAMHTLWVRDEFWIYIPNSFTPDEDMVNDKFCIEYSGVRENTFLFKVFNSQGDLIFQLTNPRILKCSIGGGWNGKDLEANIDLPLDTYLYEIYFQDFEGWKHQEYGVLNLVR
ncbi:MAG: PKD domain-containing protein [Bacteroidota bacterium]|nr:PKD domain-containing protein [Bacteroidota bacterium]